MNFNFSLIMLAAMISVGITELIKNFLPSTVSSKVTSAVAIAISALCSVALCIYQKMDLQSIFTTTLVVVGIAQTSYNYVLRILNRYIELLTEKVLQYQIGTELDMNDLDNEDADVTVEPTTETKTEATETKTE